MKLVGSGGQQVQHPLYVADGTITTGGTAQLMLARSMSRSFLMIQNLSAGPMWLEFGSARATATLTSGVVTSFSVTNAGFNFTLPPVVALLGGGKANNNLYVGLGQPGGPAPPNAATAIAVMTGSAPNKTLSSISVVNGGSNYATAPYVFMRNSDLDPNGCAVPSTGVGLLLAAQTPPLIFDATMCTTDPVAVFGATTGQAYVCRWAD